MPLILVVGGSLGAVALGSWLLARRVRYGTSTRSQPARAHVEVQPAPPSIESFAESNTANPPSMSNEVPTVSSDDVLYMHADATNAAEPGAQDAIVGSTSFPRNQDNTPRAARSDLFDTAASWATTDNPATHAVAPFADHGSGVPEASRQAIMDSSLSFEVKAADIAVPRDERSSRGKEDAAHLASAYLLNASSISAAIALAPAPPAEINETAVKAVQGVVREDANAQVLQNRVDELLAARSNGDEKAEEPFGADDPIPNAQDLATKAEIASAVKPQEMNVAGITVSGGEVLPSKERDVARVDGARLTLEAPAVDVNAVDIEARATADRGSVEPDLRSKLLHLVVADGGAASGQIPATLDVAAGTLQQGVPILDELVNPTINAIVQQPEVQPLVASDADAEAKEAAPDFCGGSDPKTNPPGQSAPVGEIETADTIGVFSTERQVPSARRVEDLHGEGAQPTIHGPVADAANAEIEIEGVSGESDELYWDADPLPDPPQLANAERVDELAAREKRYSRQPYVARHRDRRGQRRAPPAKLASTPEPITPVLATQSRQPAELRLRLILHPVRRTAGLSAVLTRPAGYPEIITLRQEAAADVRAYGENRYDDVDLEWTPSLLSGELRLDCEQGYQWLRSSRRVHVFRAVADEPNLVSVGFAALRSPCAIVCSSEDADAIRSATRMCGSPELTSHDRWSGIPDGWTVFSNYVPTHAASQDLEADLTPLDPGVGAEIRLTGVLQISAAAFAEGSPPRIEITPFPAGACVTIDGAAAEMGDDGAWRADGWDAPGEHLVDVVPGPSATYRILADPWANDGWESWDAHPGRFTAGGDAPWAQVRICGANLSGPLGEHLIAAEPMATLMALGQQRGLVTLRPRFDAPIAVGLMRDAPAFLISASGPRRTQGRISWLAPSTAASSDRSIDPQWVSAVRGVALRRLTLESESVAGHGAWRRARDRARRYVKEDK